MALDFDPNAASSPQSGIFGLPHSPEEAKVVVIPVPFEATTSYGGGTARGPDAILSASRQVDLFDLETGRPYEAGISMLEEPALVRTLNEQAKRLAGPIIEVGGASPGSGLAELLRRVNDLCEQMNDWVYKTSQYWLSQGKWVATLGGDHSVSYGAIRAHAEKFPELGLLHIDAHADLREAYEGFVWSHASIMFNVMERIPQIKKLVQVGIRDFAEAEYNYIQGSGGRASAFFDTQLRSARLGGASWHSQVNEITAALPQSVYISFDIDGLEPTLCPHTGTPVPGGLSFAEACALVEGIVRSGRTIVGLDLTEVAPAPDGSEWDGNVASRLLYKIIGWAQLSQSRTRL